MDKTKIEIITQLVNSVNLTNINYSLIKSNCGYLYEIFKKIKSCYLIKESEIDLGLKVKHTIIAKNSEKYNNIMQILKNSLFADYEYIKKEIKNIGKIIKLSDCNIKFYYLDMENYERDIELINELFLQSVCLAKYSGVYIKNYKTEKTEKTTNTKVMIIWLPIDKKRDFEYNEINDSNLLKSIKNFNAFTASGVTYGENPRVTLISRYEEISKLLIHELIHNFNLDGSGYHEHNHSLIKTYKNIKNPNTNLKIKNYDYAYSIYESYTELLSSYFSMIFRNLDLNDEHNILLRFETEILIELLYSYNTISNLIKLNGYKTYEEFESEKKFKGDICIYEYYYLKGLMYNNYELKICDNKKTFNDNYLNIININKNDPLLKDVYNEMKPYFNFRYTFYNNAKENKYKV
jgi:hypothetical protein